MGTRLLAVDVSSPFGSLAVIEAGRVVNEKQLYALDGFGQTIFDHIEALLRDHGASIEHFDAFAAAAGPGSFTGVRVGLAAIKGLAEALGRPAFGISNLRALASYGSSPLRAAVMDARRGEVYGGVFNSHLQVEQSERVLPFEAWLTALPVGVSELIVPDFSDFRSLFHLDIPVLERRYLAAGVGRIAADEFEKGLRPDPLALDANYVRRPDAELKPRRVSGENAGTR